MLMDDKRVQYSLWEEGRKVQVFKEHEVTQIMQDYEELLKNSQENMDQSLELER